MQLARVRLTADEAYGTLGGELGLGGVAGGSTLDWRGGAILPPTRQDVGHGEGGVGARTTYSKLIPVLMKTLGTTLSCCTSNNLLHCV